MKILSSNRGMVMGFAILTAFLAALSSYVMLQLVVSGAQHARYYRNRSISRYAAEAGLVWAQQQMWSGLGGCFGANPDIQIDHDGNVATPPINVDIIATPCPPAETRLTAVVTWAGGF